LITSAMQLNVSKKTDIISLEGGIYK